MATQIDTALRQIVVVKDARIRPMMGNSVLEFLPLAGIPYSMVDPYILVHEATVKITPEQANQDTTHPHRGFDNLWYAISGSSSTGHSTGPGGTFERAKLDEGSVVKVRTGRGVYHAEGLGKDELEEGKVGTEMRGLRSGSTWPARTRTLIPPRRLWSALISPFGTRATPPFGRWSARARRSHLGLRA